MVIFGFGHRGYLRLARARISFPFGRFSPEDLKIAPKGLLPPCFCPKPKASFAPANPVRAIQEETMTTTTRRTLPLRLAMALVLALGLPATAQACSLARVNGADQVVPVQGRINQALIDAAIRAEVNLQRCKAGLSELAGDSGLADAAATHAKWMARANSLSHQSSVPGQSTVLARLRSAGINFRVGSENIGQVARYNIDGTQFRVRDISVCAFATPAGAPIGAHSYQSLAHHIVTLWVNSPKHRRNMLDPRVRMVGSGIGYDAKAPYCGAFYLSQDYAG